MRVAIFVLLTVLLVTGPSDAQAETKAELVSTALAWDEGTHNSSPDLIRFKDRWYLVCREGRDRHTADGVVRVITSVDGVKWEGVAKIESPTPGRGLFDPRLSVNRDGELTITALGIVPTPDVPEPLPMFGGTVQTLAWQAADGKTWSDVKYIGVHNYPLSRLSSQGDVAYGYAHGCICGSMQTVQIFANKDGKRLESVFQETFSGFFPEDAALAFTKDTGYCLMSRASTEINNPTQSGYLGVAKTPFTDWQWKKMNAVFTAPNLIRLPGDRLIAAVGLHDGKSRTSLCELDPAKGELKELLELPTSGVSDVGLALHDGQVWVSYQENLKGKMSVQVARVKVDF